MGKDNEVEKKVSQKNHRFFVLIPAVNFSPFLFTSWFIRRLWKNMLIAILHILFQSPRFRPRRFSPNYEIADFCVKNSFSSLRFLSLACYDSGNSNLTLPRCLLHADCSANCNKVTKERYEFQSLLGT
jgi:hypothetical protein